MSINVDDIVKLAKGETVEMKDNGARETLVEHGKALEELNERRGALEKGPHFTKRGEKKLISKVLGESLPYVDRNGHLLAVGNRVRWQKEGVEYRYWSIIDLYWEMALPVAVLQENGLQCIAPANEVVFIGARISSTLEEGENTDSLLLVAEKDAIGSDFVVTIVAQNDDEYYAKLNERLREFLGDCIPIERISADMLVCCSSIFDKQPKILIRRSEAGLGGFDKNGTTVLLDARVLWGIGYRMQPKKWRVIGTYSIGAGKDLVVTLYDHGVFATAFAHEVEVVVTEGESK